MDFKDVYMFSENDKKNASNMMKQYFMLKEQYKDVILFYRLGDFYELFDEDAVLCSRLLDLTLTSKNCSLDNKVAMCGVPAKACDIYLKKLLSLGYKVGICEQLTDPKEGGKELVERDVVRIVTPGTIMEDEILEQKKNNYIACIYYNKDYSINFAENLNRILKEQNISYYKLGKSIGISDNTVSRLKQGKNLPSYSTLVDIANFLDCSIDELVGRKHTIM